MIALLALAALQTAPAPELPTDEEIVVTGRRMSQVQIAAGVNRMTGKTRCRVTVSSGDPAIDREICEIAKACGQVKPRNRDLIEACIGGRKARFLRTYVPSARSGA
ncbi:MAG TPA: hypothetical protein VF688_03390 [Allosphingosinicella sp.]|jgi:hypothetical protein